MLRNELPDLFGPRVESAYAVIVPSPKEAMAKRILDSLGAAPGAGRLPPVRRARPRAGRRLPVTKSVVAGVRDIIENWPHPKLRWEDLVPAVNKEFRANWHRQSLANHDKIKAAFQAKKLELRKAATTGMKPRRSGDSTVVYLEKQLRAAKEQMDEMRLELQQAHARMARWRHNAYLRGITVEQLDAPMQENDRGRSDR